MCGRFHLKSTPVEILEHYGVEEDGMDSAPMPSGEVFPGTEPFVVSQSEDGTHIGPMFWGFRPFEIQGKKKQPINAKRESMFTSNYWKSSALSRRCLIPVNSWDEWLAQPGESKQRWRLGPQIESPLFSLGGLYVSYDEEGADRKTGFAVITQPANKAIEDIHHRQPLIVMPEDYGVWLDADIEESEVQRVTYRQGVNYRRERVG